MRGIVTGIHGVPDLGSWLRRSVIRYLPLEVWFDAVMGNSIQLHNERERWWTPILWVSRLAATT